MQDIRGGKVQFPQLRIDKAMLHQWLIASLG